MNRILLCLLFTLLATALYPAAANAAESQDYLCIPYQQAGPITPSATISDLLRIFGEDQVRRQTVLAAEGTERREVTIIHPGTKAELTVLWQNDRYGGAPAAVWLRTPGSPWKTIAGISVGTTLTELNAINGRPFRFNGLGWDYGGYILPDPNGGVLTATPGLSLQLYAVPGLPRELLGDGVKLSSDDSRLPADIIRVGFIAVDLAPNAR